MKKRLYRRIKKFKGVGYFLVFTLLGLSILFDSRDTDIRSVLEHLDTLYPIVLIAAVFMLSGVINLYIGFTDIDWHILGFLVLYIYSIAVFCAYLNGELPLLTLVTYIGLCFISSLDVAMDVFVLPKCIEETSLNGVGQ